MLDVRSVTSPARWESLFASVGMPHITQSWAYGEAKRTVARWGLRHVAFDAGGWRPRRLVFSRSGRPLAICQVMDKAVGGVGVASLVNRGPLFLGPAEPAADAIRDVYAALRRRDGALRRPLVIAPALTETPAHRALLQELGYRDRHVAGWESVRVDLERSEEEILMSLRPTWRRSLRAAGRHGVTTSVSQSPDVVEWMVERHIENMAAKGFRSPSAQMVRAFYAAAPDSFIVVRAFVRGVVAAGMLSFGAGRLAEGYVMWMSTEGREVDIGVHAYWASAVELRRRGFSRLDLGGTSREGTREFKLGMRGEPYTLLGTRWTL